MKPYLFIMLALIAIGSGAYWYQHQFARHNLASLQYAAADLLTPEGTPPTFHLTADTGKAFSNPDLKGHWTFLFFGFTNCGYLCPTTMASLNQVEKNLEAQKIKAPRQFWFVSIDPARDDLATIKRYVEGFNKNFHGARGSDAEIAALTKTLGIVYMQTKPAKAGKNYQIDHSGTLMLFNPEGNLQAVFAFPHNAGNITQDFKTITANYG